MPAGTISKISRSSSFSSVTPTLKSPSVARVGADRAKGVLTVVRVLFAMAIAIAIPMMRLEMADRSRSVDCRRRTRDGDRFLERRNVHHQRDMLRLAVWQLELMLKRNEAPEFGAYRIGAVGQANERRHTTFVGHALSCGDAGECHVDARQHSAAGIRDREDARFLDYRRWQGGVVQRSPPRPIRMERRSLA